MEVTRGEIMGVAAMRCMLAGLSGAAATPVRSTDIMLLNRHMVERGSWLRHVTRMPPLQLMARRPRGNVSARHVVSTHWLGWMSFEAVVASIGLT